MKKIFRMDDIPEKLLNANSERKYYKKNEYIASEGDEVENMYILLKGEFTNIIYSKDGKSNYGFLVAAPCITTGYYQFTNFICSGTMKTLSKCEAILIDKKIVQEIINSDIEIAKYVYNIPFITENSVMAAHLEYLVMSNEEKITSIIIEFAENFGEKSNGKIKINYKLTQQIISNLTGVGTRATANILKKLKDRKIINYQKGCYYLENIELINKNM